MSTFLKKLYLAGLVSATLLGHAWEWVGGCFLTQAGRTRRASDLEFEEQEWERLDRLRNPSDYLGK